MKSSTDYINLNRYTQQQKWFNSYQQTQPVTMAGRQEKKFSIEKSTLTPFQRLISFREGRLSEDTQAQEWMQRCQWMSTKWMDRQKFNLKTNYVYSKNLEESWFDELYEKAKKLTRPDEIIPLLDFHYKDDRQQDALKEKNMFKALKILLLLGKLRKNFLHFQCRMKGDEQQIVNFITGIEPMLGDHLYLEKQNYLVNLDAPERTVKFSFQRVVGSNKKMLLRWLYLI